MKEKFILIFFYCVRGSPFGNPLKTLLNPFQLGQDRTKHAQDSSFSNRNWRVTSYQELRPGVDTVEAPQWTLNNHYYPPPNQHYTSTNINAKKDGVFSFLPDISLPKFDKIFADLRVKRNDVETAIQELVRIPSFNTVAESVQRYFSSGDVAKKDGLSVVFKGATDRQDISRQGQGQGLNERALAVGTALLLSLITGGSIGAVIKDVADKIRDDKEKNKKTKYDIVCKKQKKKERNYFRYLL